jgi:hypothetical protein
VDLSSDYYEDGKHNIVNIWDVETTALETILIGRRNELHEFFSDGTPRNRFEIPWREWESENPQWRNYGKPIWVPITMAYLPQHRKYIYCVRRLTQSIYRTAVFSETGEYQGLLREWPGNYPNITLPLASATENQIHSKFSTPVASGFVTTSNQISQNVGDAESTTGIKDDMLLYQVIVMHNGDIFANSMNHRSDKVLCKVDFFERNGNFFFKVAGAKFSSASELTDGVGQKPRHRYMVRNAVGNLVVADTLRPHAWEYRESKSGFYQQIAPYTLDLPDRVIPSPDPQQLKDGDFSLYDIYKSSALWGLDQVGDRYVAAYRNPAADAELGFSLKIVIASLDDRNYKSKIHRQFDPVANSVYIGSFFDSVYFWNIEKGAIGAFDISEDLE